ncbi:Asp23/Gls24 family envelope stress response protein [Yinghuangia sp. ASG 101]|uniref:Asp23/Gls24 family envelope stress response protein n=1 Tax=Yinghuangia sp. ASG 101 TaxID=2896848 RepID=UPI001E423092|nr:Asp23/Gls24 family envelope stress response protein [Yinghuangia sp. ASG 101]UGQ12746.1 Asp23/Gls24 family envelope stress response protein [Yinghuangia sp. ASG 101]
MAETKTDTGTTRGASPAASGGAEVAVADEAFALDTVAPLAVAAERGHTRIADGVVAKIAGLAARDTAGVHALGRGTARAFGAVRERIPGAKPNVAQGVSVEVGTRQCAVDVALVVDYGVPIAELAAEVRDNIITALEGMTGLEVVAVDIAVDDIHIGDDRDERRVE